MDLARAGKVVVFVLDEFDLFGRRAKQTALYNLLDAMQAADMQVKGKHLCLHAEHAKAAGGGVVSGRGLHS